MTRSSLVFLLLFSTHPVFAGDGASVKANHPLHVSTTDISYNTGDRKLEVVCTIFYDDGEAALNQAFRRHTDLSKPELHTQMDALMKKYVLSHLRIQASGKALTLHYVGFEKAREVVNVYFESEPVPAPKIIAADVSLLYNLFDDQMNIVHMTVNGTRKSTRLDYPDHQVTQNF